MKRILSVIFIILFVCSIMVSCQENGNEVNSNTKSVEETSGEIQTLEPETDEPVITLDIVDTGATSFNIVYPYGNDTIFSSAKKVADGFSDYLGAKLSIKTDMFITADEEYTEILIGNTNRPETAKALEKIRYFKDYFVGVIGNKFVIVGKEDATTEKAVTYFLMHYIYTGKKGTTNGSFSFVSDKNFLYHANYDVKNCTIDGIDLEKYKIVYPAAPIQGELYVAEVLQMYLFDHAGVKLDIAPDTENESEYEILIGKTKRHTATVDENKYAIHVWEKKLQLVAGNYFGYLNLVDYLENELFIKNEDDLCIEADYTFTDVSKYEASMTKSGEYRVMFWNQYCKQYIKNDIGCPVGVYNTPEYTAAVLLGYGADVFGLNEYIDWMRENSSLISLLNKGGYVEAKPSNTTQNTQRPIFYNPNTVNLIECKMVYYFNTQEDISKWPADASEVSVQDAEWGLIYGVFESKTSGERFIVCPAHFASAWNCTQDVANEKKLYQVSVIAPALKSVSEKYNNAPVFIGGDYNSSRAGVANRTGCCNALLNAGFKDTYDIASKKNVFCSCHGYPQYSKVYNRLIPYTLGGANNHGESIDHIFVYGANYTVKMQWTVHDDTVGVVSDHCPVLCDFNINS